MKVREVLRELEALGTEKDRANLDRFGITTNKAFGVSMTRMQGLAKRVGRSHELAQELWDTEWYEARMLTSFVDEKDRVTSSQMDRWCKDFDNWAICDTLCFKLWDRTPHAWGKVSKWSTRKAEFEKRAAFAMLASIALHDKQCPDEPFVESLPIIARAASDDRNFVKKGVSWALRGIGKRNRTLKAESIVLARRLAEAPETAARWVGRDVLRDLAKSRK